MRARGFTLIELMITVAILGVLASLALPTFQRFQLRARAAEAVTNLSSIRKAETAYFSEFGTYLDSGGPTPAAPPGSSRVAWPPGSPFAQLGWEPDGSVLFQYAVRADNNGAGAPLVRFTAEAAGDIDGDGAFAFWGFVKPVPGAAAGLPGSIPGSTCVGTGVYNPTTGGQDLIETVGPCNAIAGRSVF